MAHDPHHTRYYRQGRLFSEVLHEDALGHCVPLLDAATGEPVNFERKPSALTRALKAMRTMDKFYIPGEIEWESTSKTG